jgi:ABC-type glutathione transport system ATPase component
MNAALVAPAAGGASALTPDQAPVLVVEGVRKEFRVRGHAKVAVADCSFTVAPGQTLAVVGESGAGKSTLAKVIAGLEAPTRGRVLVKGRPLVTKGGQASPVQMVFQQPAESLDPFHAVGRSVAEPLHGMSGEERQRQVAALLTRVGINPSHAGRRPVAFSGGQLQRIVLARALAAEPAVLLCDEPTSALDVSVQAQIVNLLLELQASIGFACVLVTHDLSLVRVLADDVLVLRDGIVEERTPADEFFAGPASAYGAALLEANRQQSLHRVS